MKRRFCLVLSLLMLAVCIPALAESAQWNYDAEYCVLRGYSGAGGDVAVPGEINGGTVDVIDINVFTGEAITALSLPETVLELRSNAITWCPNLVSVSLPQSLVVINRLNFGNCGALAEVTIPAGVRYIGDSSFTFCESLRKITFEGVCPVIDQDCFTVLPEDAVAYVPDDQLDAYAEAFASAGSAVSVQPSGKSAVVVDNNGYVESEFDFDASTGTITSYNGYATYLAIPETIGGAAVKAIGPKAFAQHTYIALAELPEGLETIGDNAFYNCETLARVVFPSTLKRIGDYAFYNAYRSNVLELPSVEHIGAYAFYAIGVTDALDISGYQNRLLNTNSTDADVSELKKLADDTGIRISSIGGIVSFTIYPLTAQDPQTARKSMDAVKKMLDSARILGADTVLVIPGMLTADMEYQAAYDLAQERVARLAAHAPDIQLAVENVWNGMLYSPLEMSRFVDETGCGNVGVYFDIANARRFGWPQQWIRTLGRRIRQFHCKDYRMAVDTINGFTNLLDGDVDWPEVVSAIRETGYDGEMVVELVPPARHLVENTLVYAQSTLRELLK